MHRVHIIALSIGTLAIVIIGLAVWHYHQFDPTSAPRSAAVNHVPLRSIVEERTAYLPVDSPGEARIDPQKIVEAIANFQKTNPTAMITSSDVVAHGVIVTWECSCKIK